MQGPRRGTAPRGDRLHQHGPGPAAGLGLKGSGGAKNTEVSGGREGEAEQQNWLNCSFIINLLHYKYFPLLGSLGLLHFLPETPNLRSALN